MKKYIAQVLDKGMKKRSKRKNKINRPLPIEREQIHVSQTRIYRFTYHDIIFKNREIEIYIKGQSIRFRTIKCAKSIEQLNTIKEEFFLRHDGHKLYKLRALENEIFLEWSDDLQRVLLLIDLAIEYYSFKHEKHKRVKLFSDKYLKALPNDKILSIFNSNLDRTTSYVKFLYNLHSQEFKLIPVLEFIGNTKEESFLFRLKNKSGPTLVVWENLNPGRATYLFKLWRKDNFNNILLYITELRHLKRSYLRSRDNTEWAKKELGYIGFVEHENINSYIYQIQLMLH